MRLVARHTASSPPAADRGTRTTDHGPRPSSFSLQPLAFSLCSAFSLIEFVGVLAVIAVLAALMVPSVVRRVDLAAYSSESATLSAMADALKQYVVQSNSIPNQTQWYSAITNQLGLSPANIMNTPRGSSRAYLMDAGGWLGTLSFVSGYWTQSPGGTVQTPGGTNAPSGARLMIVSTIAPPASSSALPVSSGMLPTADFNNIWYWSNTNGQSPWPSWSGSCNDLVVQRINLDPLFHHLILVTGSVGGQGLFSINGSTPTRVPLGGSGTNTYYLDGSVLGLYDAYTNLMASEIIRGDLSRVFEYGLWRDQINQGTTTGVPPGLSWIAATFYTNAPPGGWTNNLNQSGGTPQAVFGLLNSFMNGYATWAAMQPCFSYPGTNINIATYPPYQEIHDALNAFGNSGNVVP